MSREAVVEAILAADRVTAICHENPDADTLGSALALRFAAERLGKQAEVVAADPVPPSLAHLPGMGDVRSRPQLVIRHDDSIESGDRVLRILKELEEGQGS